MGAGGRGDHLRPRGWFFIPIHLFLNPQPVKYAPGCSWLLLAALGCCWLLLAAPGFSWLLLAAEYQENLSVIASTLYSLYMSQGPFELKQLSPHTEENLALHFAQCFTLAAERSDVPRILPCAIFQSFRCSVHHTFTNNLRLSNSLRKPLQQAAPFPLALL